VSVDRESNTYTLNPEYYLLRLFGKHLQPGARLIDSYCRYSQWSRKENKKTISVALSEDQYAAMKRAIENWKQAQQTLKRMQQVSRAIIFKTTPDTTRRKPLSNKVLGIN